ncbi:unnamed protein product [Cylicocyclus nassatus]|uniref:Uncharacterized protein n=1 Tax=Cylicocyclus nassatus TaxID=53992 RepID=A0AA36GX74_CYLNA|nr:unnamed protein product [Cylicocyclus nassatus]
MSSPDDYNKEQSWSKSSFIWFRHGCCVPTTSVLWMIVVLFIFTIATLLCCCFTMLFIRWLYKRRIRKKTEDVREKYRKKDDRQKENELRLKEIALRPIQKRVFLPCPDHEHHDNDTRLPPMDSTQRGVISDQRGSQNLAGIGSDKMEVPQSPNLASPGKSLNPPMFTGATPLSSTQQLLAPKKPSSLKGSKEGSGSAEISKDLMPHLFTGRTPLSSSQQILVPPQAGSGANAHELGSAHDKPIHIGARDVAATVHTIAKHSEVKEERPPVSGIVLTSDGKKDSASDIIGPQCSKSADPSSVPMKGSAIESETTTGTERNSPKTSAQRRRSSEVGVTSSSSDQLAADVAKKRGKQERRVKQEKHIVKRQGAVHIIDVSPKRVSEMRPTAPFFPYWTAQRSISRNVEQNATPSGRLVTSKVTTSEASSWAPIGARSTEPTRSYAKTTDTASKDGKKSRSSEFTPPPVRDVYQLRRELERMQANQLALGMQDFLEEEGKRKRQRSIRSLSVPKATDADIKMPPSNLRNRSASQSSSHSSPKRYAPTSKLPPPRYPSMFAALRAALQGSSGRARVDAPIENC